MNTLIVVGLILVLYWKVKNQYYMRLTETFRYKMFDLRDFLRDLAIEKKISCDDWRFKYLDTSISKTVNDLEFVNLLAGVIIYKRYKNDTEFNRLKDIVEQTLSNDLYFKMVYYEYGLLIRDYISKKHHFLRWIIRLKNKQLTQKQMKKANVLKRFQSRMHESFNKIISVFKIAPETSTLYTFADIH